MTTYDSVLQYASPAYGTIFAGHFNETDRYAASRPEGMADWLLAYTLEGEGYYRTPSGERRCRPGDVCLLRGGVPHEYGTVPGSRWNFIWTHFPGMTETKYLPEEELLRISLGDEPTRKRVYRALRNVLQDSRGRRHLWESICENEIRGVLLLMAERGRRKIDSRVEEALHYLSRHMNETLRVERLARSVGLSVSRLSHLFKEETGSTLVEALCEMRISQAALLMRMAGRTATEAALDVGFQNYNHFATMFRRRMGVSPAEYRRKSADE